MHWSARTRRIVINLAWLGTQIRDYLGDGSRYGAVIHYSEEAPRALQPAGGIFRALPLLLPGPFVVVNGDVYSDFPLGTLSLASDKDAHLVLVPNPEGYKGDFGLQKGLAVPEEMAKDSPLSTYSGIGIFRPAFFAGCSDGSFALKPLLLRSMSVSRCSAQLYQGKWVDVGTPERLEALNRAVGRVKKLFRVQLGSCPSLKPNPIRAHRALCGAGKNIRRFKGLRPSRMASSSP